MQNAIFGYEIGFWEKFKDKFNSYEQALPRDAILIELGFQFTLNTLKSYRPHPNGNGIKWNKEEKQAFMKLSYKEQRKMIIKKSELKSAFFPHVNVDYESYTYSERISDSAKRAYTKAQTLLKANEKLDFNNIKSQIQNDILQNLRLAYKEKYLRAGVELAKLLFKKANMQNNKEAQQQMQECAKITKDLLYEKIPDNSYMYYQLYKYSIDTERLFRVDIGYGFNREQAKECYEHALESIVWEAIDEEGQRMDNTLFAAELYLAAGIKYQSPLAFYLAALNYAPSGTSNEWLEYLLIPYNACLRCSIALGSNDALETLMNNYEYGLRGLRANPLQAKLLQSYKVKRAQGLINGLDPYFDEKFIPEAIIDGGNFTSGIYGGTIVYPGISRLIRGENYYGIQIKDPRDVDSTPQSIKEFYLRMWEMLVSFYKDVNVKTDKKLTIPDYAIYLIYKNLQYGYPSARPYIFPKEVLDIEIDFNKGLEGYGMDIDEKK